MPNYLIVLSVSLAVSLLLVFTKQWHGRFSFDHPQGVQKFHITPTPRVGGIAIFSGLLAGWYVSAGEQRELLRILMIAGIPAFAFGLLEDVTKRVGVVARLLATMASGVVACLISGLAISKFDIPMLDGLLAYWPIAVLITAIAVGGIANAINIIDGFNGLSSGTVIISLLSLSLIARGQGDTVLASCCMLLALAVMGFFLVNFPLGKIFLGDGGAYFIGFALAWLEILLVVRNPSVSPWVMALVTAYPLIEVFYSMGRRIRSKKSAGDPDNLHLHSLIKTQLILPTLKAWPPYLMNAAVSPLVWIYAAIPASIAVGLAGQSVWILVVVFILCALLYHVLYVLLRRTIKVSAA